MLQDGSAGKPFAGQCPASLAKRMRERQQAKIAELRHALVECGCRTVLEQARALGLSRSSAWALLSAGHKCNGLSPHLIARVASSPELPPKAKKILQEYVHNKLAGAYGHPKHRLKLFRAKLDAAGFFIGSPMEACIPSYATPVELNGIENRARLVP
jgi:hypothetical protein